MFALGKHANKSDGELVKKLFESVGICDQIPENLIDAVTALSGSGPAYVCVIIILVENFYRYYLLQTYMTMEALADAGVREGIPRELSYNLVAQTLIG